MWQWRGFDKPRPLYNLPAVAARPKATVIVVEGEKTADAAGRLFPHAVATTWQGVVNPPRVGRVREWHYADRSISLHQGDEMGRFLLGSTVVLLFPKEGHVQFNASWQEATPVRMGEPMSRT